MIIGIDLRALQTGHKFRGIGEVAKQVTNRLLELARNDNTKSFIFYEFDGDDPKELLDIPESIKYEVIKLGPMPEDDFYASIKHKLDRHFKDMFGHAIKKSFLCDVFLQFDYAFGVPKNTKTVLIKHDLIPVVFWKQYFESPMVHFQNKAARTMARTIFNNYKFGRVLKRSLKSAHQIITVSKSTRQDLKRYYKVPETKMVVVHLGVDMKLSKTKQTDITTSLPSKPFLLFIGAGDARRKVQDAVYAFNSLKASGEDIQLVLVGENFKSPSTIPNKTVRDAVMKSSYGNDILTLGYVSDEAKQYLFKNAIAYVYPTLYEGFGIPILEAMLSECPVITYKNSSIPEVSGSHAYYAIDWEDIARHTKTLIRQTDSERQQVTFAARNHASKFTWDKTAKAIYSTITTV